MQKGSSGSNEISTATKLCFKLYVFFQTPGMCGINELTFVIYFRELLIIVISL